MIEFEYDPPLHVRLRLGRWHFRSWQSRFMLLPRRYQSPTMTYAVVQLDEEDQAPDSQYGAFFDLHAAEACVAQLEAEGASNVAINYLPVHARLRDWEWDR